MNALEHTVKIPTAPFRTASGALEVHQLPAAQDNLVWVLVSLNSGEAAVIDGPDATAALDCCARIGARITHVLNTHTHPDHIGLNRDLANRGLLKNMTVLGPQKTARDVPGLTRAVGHGDGVSFGNVGGRVLLTEGHVVGHVSFLFEDVVFCGDALFTAGCGRVFTGDHKSMFEGLTRLAELDPRTRVCCAHEYTLDSLAFARSMEPDNVALAERSRRVTELRARGECAVPSTIGEELATNPFLRSDSPEIIAQVKRQAPEADVSSKLAVFTATRKLKDSGAYKRSQ